MFIFVSKIIVNSVEIGLYNRFLIRFYVGTKNDKELP